MSLYSLDSLSDMDQNTVRLPQPSTSPIGVQIKWPTFSGAPSDNVLVFFQEIYRFAFAHGREQDEVWMAGYAYTCLVEAALDWYEDLDPELKQNWSSLRAVMIKRFRQDRLVSSSLMAATGSHGASSHCRILLVRESGAVLGYVSPPSPKGDSPFQTSSNGALVLDVPVPSSGQQGPYLVRIIDPDKDMSYPFLGVERTRNYWNLRACERERPGALFKGRASACTERLAPEASSKVWSTSSTDGLTEELRMTWTVDKTTTKIHGRIYTESITRNSSNKTFWMRETVDGGEEPLKLILERF